MKTFLSLLLFVLFLCTPVLSDQKTDDAIYLDMLKEYTLHDDGSWTMRQMHQLKIVSYFSLNRRHGETFIVYDTLFQKLKINHCFTTMVNGREIHSPENAFNQVLPRFAANSPAHNHLREMVVTHTGLEIGAVINLDYEMRTQSDFLPGMMGDVLLTADVPVKNLTIRIKLPQNKTLKFQLFNSERKAEEKQNGSSKILEWKFTDLPAVISEPMQANQADFSPRLVFSTVDDWQKIYDYLNIENVVAVEQNIRSHFFDNDVSAMLKILSTQSKIINETALINVPFAAIGFRYRQPQEVWQSNSGTLLEKAIFMASMLKGEGIQAKPVLVSSKISFDKDIPSLLPFDDVMVCAQPQPGEKIFFSVQKLNAHSLSHDFAGHFVLPLDAERSGPKQLPLKDDIINASMLKVNLNVSDSASLSGTMQMALEGAAIPYIKIQDAEGEIGQAVDNIKIKEPILRELSAEKLIIEAKIDDNPALKAQAGYYTMQIPESQYGVNQLNIPVLSQTRMTPFQLPYASFRDESKLTINFHETFTPVVKAVDISKQNAIGRIQIRIEPVGNTVKIKRSIQLNRQVIQPQEYNQFLEIWQLWQTPVYNSVMFKK